jgi:hypothetical protein
MGRPTPHRDEIRAGPCPVLWGCGDTPESPWHEIDRGSFEAKDYRRGLRRRPASYALTGLDHAPGVTTASAALASPSLMGIEQIRDLHNVRSRIRTRQLARTHISAPRSASRLHGLSVRPLSGGSGAGPHRLYAFSFEIPDGHLASGHGH